MHGVIWNTFAVSPEGGVAVLPAMAVVEPGALVEFLCSVQGGPSITYQWQRYGIDLPGETSDILLIANVSVVDGGDYMCIASNAAGSGNSTSRLLVTPTITTQPVDQHVSNGSTVAFNCVAESFPDPVYTWEKYHKENSSLRVVSSGSVLQFQPAVFGDEGSYRCVAHLPGTNRTVTSRLAVVNGKKSRSFVCNLYIHYISVILCSILYSLY